MPRTLSSSLAWRKKSLLFLGFLALLATPVHLHAQAARSAQSETAAAQTVRMIKAASSGDWEQARILMGQTRDPLANELYAWMFLTKNADQADFGTMAQFIRRYPDWPGVKDLRARAEMLMPAGLSPAEVSVWFADYEPQTGNGIDRYVRALIDQGQLDKARTLIRQWWSDAKLGREEQKFIYSKYGGLIDAQAHARRMDMLLFASSYTNARAVAGVLGHGYPELVEARIALAEENPNASALIAKVPSNLRNDPGLIFERIRWRRRNDMDSEAVELLRHAPPPSQVKNPEDWWQERHIMIRRLIEEKQYRNAYELAVQHGQSEGLPFAQAEWMAGWLALRFLHKPETALQHFEKLHQGVDTPISQSRAAYWAGRAAAAMKAGELARRWYEIAAQNQTVFYGQLAGAELGRGEALPNAAPPQLSAADLQALRAEPMIQAALRFDEAGMKPQARKFLLAFVDQQATPKAYRFVAELAAKMKYYDTALRVAKNATTKGMFLTTQAYPVITSHLTGIDEEWALLHALIRQESMFDADARSPAGAMGLMQVMPATAAETAGKAGLAYNAGWLTSRPQYNIAIGGHYIGNMLARFGGSYPLAIAAYNAGPGRVDDWIETYGDPRTGQVDLIDWIEMIPIYETRNYVQRVLENVYVYRLRLAGQQNSYAGPIHVAMVYGH